MSEVSLLKQALCSVVAGQVKAAADPYRPGWHLAPPVGLRTEKVARAKNRKAIGWSARTAAKALQK